MNIPIFDVALPIQKILYSRNFKAANIGSTLDLKHLQKKASIEARVKDELAKAMPTATVTPMPTVTDSTPKQHLQQHRTP